MSGTTFFPFSRSPVHRSTLVATALLLSAATLMSAQEATVSPGDRVRVRRACEGSAKPAPCRTEVGKVVAVVGDTILLDDIGNGKRRLVLGPTSKIQLSTGRHGHALLGLGIGTAVGIGAGALSCSNNDHSDMGSLCALAYLFTVPAGMLGGLVIGALTKSDKWETVHQPSSRLEVVPAVMPDGVGVAGSLRF